MKTYVSKPTQNSCIDIDGNVYQTVQIGDQVWTAENLKVTHYRNGDPISHLTDDDDWPYYDNPSIGRSAESLGNSAESLGRGAESLGNSARFLGNSARFLGTSNF